MDERSDIEQLRDELPGWNFGTVWTTANSGPDRRRLWAFKDGAILSAWTAAELRSQVEDEMRWAEGK